MAGLVLGGGFITVGGNRGFIAMVGFLQYYFDPKNGFHLQALGGITSGSSDGALGAGGLGYDAWVGAQTSLGVFARIGRARVTDGYIGQTDVTFGSINGTFTWH